MEEWVDADHNVTNLGDIQDEMGSMVEDVGYSKTRDTKSSKIVTLYLQIKTLLGKANMEQEEENKSILLQ